MNKKFSEFYKLAELLVLLMLPLPFLKLNLIYVFAAIAIILLSKWLMKESWSSYGFLPVNFRLLIVATGIGIAFGFFDNFVVEPLITKLTGYTPDLSTYENVRGNWPNYIILLLIGWAVGGFFEEFFFRGYLFHRIRTIIRYEVIYKVVSVILVSAVFAFAHNYQGIGGIMGTFWFSIIMGILYFVFKGNVWYLVIIHGFYDMVGITRLFMGI